MKANTIYLGNCLDILSNKIQEQSVDLIIADPPYNISGKSLNLKNNNTGGPFYKMNENWDKFSDKDYNLFTKNWIKLSKKVLKNNGSLYIFCTYHNIDVILSNAKKLGLKLNNILTWYKTNAMPNITKRTFTHSTEFILWLVKGKNWIFNYEQVKLFNPNKTKDNKPKQMRDFLDFIYLPIVQGKERIKDENGRAIHPTQKPEKLIELIMIASSYENSLVLDPFLGSGTTAVVAKKLNRKWIGIEINEKYFIISKKRLKENDE